jgi:hypothetical protein
MPDLFRFLHATVWAPARETVEAWYEDSAPRWSAAIAFYTIFSLAPVLIIVTAVAGALWGDAAVRRQVLGQFRDLLGTQGAVQVEQLIEAALPAGGGLAASLLGVVTLLVGATAVFTTLRNALNAVWGVTNPLAVPGAGEGSRGRGIQRGPRQEAAARAVKRTGRGPGPRPDLTGRAPPGQVSLVLTHESRRRRS